MKVVGLFRELGSGIDASVQSIHRLVGNLPSDSVDVVVSYLKSGVPIFDVMEGTIDPLDNSVVIEGGPSLVSDGVWVWRNDLAYFVEKYRVGLPAEFLEQVFLYKKVDDSLTDDVIGHWEEALEAYETAERGDVAGG